MKLEVTRRDVIRFGAGGALGLALSPAPWRLLDDLAIWTQNGSWIPRVPRGPVTESVSVCALCPAGCPLRARCAGGIPVQLSAATDTPLCPLGLTGHHLAWHPRRLTTAIRVRRSGKGRIATEALPAARAEAALTAVLLAARERGEAIAVLDLRPGRSVSWAWRRLLGAIPGGTLIPAPAREGAAMSAFAPPDSASRGLDLEAARTILSFGAPLAEGWGSPRNLGLLLDGTRRLIQVDPLRSRTAALASTWLPVNPGTEGLVALAIGRELSGMTTFDDATLKAVPGIDHVLRVLAGVDPVSAAKGAGVRPAVFESIARALLEGSPAVAVAGVDPAGGRLGNRADAAIAALNVLLDAAGAGGCLTARAELPPPAETSELSPVTELGDVADGSIALLVVDASAGDGSVAWPAVAAKLRRDATVVALSPFLSGTALHAGLVLPTLPFLETIGELPTPCDAPAATYALSAPLIAAREGAVDPVSLIQLLAGEAGVELPLACESTEGLLRERVARIHELARGAVARLDGDRVPVAGISSDKLWKELLAGGRWVDDAPRVPARWDLSGSGASSLEVVAASTRDTAGTRDLTLVVRGHRDVAASAVASPVMTQLYQESKLRRGPNVIAANPRTAREHGLRDGREATLETEAGRIRVTVAVDRGIPPGVVVTEIAPTAASLGIADGGGSTILDICKPDETGAWATCAARMVEV
jgi:menaquinone reductase, molybdopterin-binding-like subunit